MYRSEKQKILIIGPTPPPYHGVSTTTQTILESLLNDRFDLIHMDTTDRRGLDNLGRLDLINLYLALLHFLKFLWLLVKKKPQIIYVHISQNTLAYLRDCLFLISAKVFQKKIIVHLNGGYFRNFYEQSGRIVKKLIVYSLKDVKKAIVLGHCLKYIFQGLVPEEKISVVPNGVDGKDFEKYRAEYNIEQKKKYLRILYLSNHIRTKGFIDTIKAIPIVLNHEDNAEFVFAGEFLNNSGEKDEAFTLIKQHRIESAVKFLGVVKGAEKIKLYLSSDIFVFPTYYDYEGHPLVILEAMAAALPIITADTGAIKETVLNDENGFIVEKQNPKQIAEKILLLLKDEELRRKMGQRNRERFLKYYTKDKFIENLQKVFKKVLNGG